MATRDQLRDVTRAAITTAARELFSAQGYEAVALRDIARRAGRSTGAVFANFTDKAELYRAVTGQGPPNVPAFLRAVAKGELCGVAAANEANRLHQQLVGTRV